MSLYQTALDEAAQEKADSLLKSVVKRLRDLPAKVIYSPAEYQRPIVPFGTSRFHLQLYDWVVDVEFNDPHDWDDIEDFHWKVAAFRDGTRLEIECRNIFHAANWIKKHCI